MLSHVRELRSDVSSDTGQFCPLSLSFVFLEVLIKSVALSKEPDSGFLFL